MAFRAGHQGGGRRRKHLIHILLSHIFLFRDFGNRKIGLTIERQPKVD